MGTQYTLVEFKDFARKSLEKIYPSEEIESIIQLILEKKLNLTKIDVLLNNNYRFSQTETRELFQILEELKRQRPVQYIIGEADFYDLTLKLNEYTLIPRQETEELVDWLIKEYQGRSAKILDIGTGTGCIAIALARFLPEAYIEGIDFNEQVINLAKENSYRNKVKVNFYVMDILNEELLEGYDLIVSNPPYVRESEKKNMHGNVTEFEPAEALFVADDDPLIFYRKITEESLKALKTGGQLYFEINEYLSNEIRDLIENYGFTEIVIKNDINDKPRMIKATKI
jgi:release factor glutamine methyltransferase